MAPNDCEKHSWIEKNIVEEKAFVVWPDCGNGEENYRTEQEKTAGGVIRVGVTIAGPSRGYMCSSGCCAVDILSYSNVP